MGMDVDYLVAKDAVELIDKLLSDWEHGERQEIADEIIEFSEKLEKKFGKTVTKSQFCRIIKQRVFIF